MGFISFSPLSKTWDFCASLNFHFLFLVDCFPTLYPRVVKSKWEWKLAIYISFSILLLWKIYIAAKLLQLCPTLCDPIDGSPPGSAVPGILQARALEWVAISFSSSWKWKVKVKSLGRVWLFVTPWTVAYQAPPSMGFSRQGYWNGVPFPSPIVCWRKDNSGFGHITQGWF